MTKDFLKIKLWNINFNEVNKKEHWWQKYNSYLSGVLCIKRKCQAKFIFKIV